MDQHQVARLLAAGRLVIGGLLLVAPGVPARVWLGEDGGDRATKAMARSAGARDVVLALGALRALSEGDGARWVLGGAASDAADALATVVGIGRRHPARALLIGALCAAVATAGAAAGREIAD